MAQLLRAISVLGALIQGPWSLKQFAMPAWPVVIDESPVTRLLSLGHMVPLLSPLPFSPLSSAGIAPAAVASCTSLAPSATRHGSRSICLAVPSFPMCALGLGSLDGVVDLGQGFSRGRGCGDPVPLPASPPYTAEPQMSLRR